MFEMPRAATLTLVLVNCMMFYVCLSASGGAPFSSGLLLGLGAISKSTLAQHDYWRLVAYAFLHGNVVHIFVNMLCLLSWGGFLEARAGTTYFVLIYLFSAIGGGIASVLGHPGAFVSVGASGAISGVFGALLCLTLLGRLALSAQFFIANIGINALLMAQVPQIDWLAHVGGFTAGLAGCALLDTAERFNRLWLRCKFPEFVKFSLGLALAVSAWLAWQQVEAWKLEQDWMVLAAGFGAAALAAIKICDLVLVRKKGLAVAVIAAAALNFALPFLLRGPLEALLATPCLALSRSGGINAAWGPELIEHLCSNPTYSAAALGALAAAATLLVLAGQLVRGTRDVGFVGATLVAERKRRIGI